MDADGQIDLKAFHDTSMPTLLNGVISPTKNVATTGNGAFVIVGGNPSALLDGNDTDLRVYSYHPIGSGAIIVQLSQPYIIGSLRLLLWDGDDRTYSFYVETSVNQRDWEMAVDKRDEQLQSWQTLTFIPRPVAFSKLSAHTIVLQAILVFTVFISSVHHKNPLPVLGHKHKLLQNASTYFTFGSFAAWFTTYSSNIIRLDDRESPFTLSMICCC